MLILWLFKPACGLSAFVTTVIYRGCKRVRPDRVVRSSPFSPNADALTQPSFAPPYWPVSQTVSMHLSVLTFLSIMSLPSLPCTHAALLCCSRHCVCLVVEPGSMLLPPMLAAMSFTDASASYCQMLYRSWVDHEVGPDDPAL